jgi:hypothetical protein
MDPVLELYDPFGNIFMSNDNWRDDGNQEAIEAKGLAPTDDRESAILTALGGNPYTVIVRGKNGTAGVGLVEIYNVDP